jgi:hypothetical protein
MMEQTRTKLVTALSFALLLAAAGAHGADSKADRDKDGDRNEQAEEIEGTWIATVTPPFGAPSFLAHPSYIRGGVFIISPDRLPPALGTPIGSGQGGWRAAGHRQYLSTYVELRYGVLGEVVGTAKVRSIVRLTSDDSFEGSGQLQLCDAMLENCSPPAPPSAFATIKGRRLRVEPMVVP